MSEPQEEKEKDKKTKNNTDAENLFASRVGALLDFYSDRAVAHASFFVASIFGLVTLSAIIQQSDNHHLILLSFPIFLAFSYMGYHTLVRFRFYALVSEKLTLGLNRDETLSRIKIVEEKRTITVRDFVDEQDEMQKKRLILRKTLTTRFIRPWVEYVLGILYFAIVVLLGVVSYLA